MLTEENLRHLCERSRGRVELWSGIFDLADTRSVAEIGVWRGAFAERILRENQRIERYVLIDPWRHLDSWNKPMNVSDATFAAVMDEAVRRTSFAKDRVQVRRGTTAEVLPLTPAERFDAVYIDGDHTLRGITVDATLAFGALRDGGILGGDDFTPTIWQHDLQREPTLVFPYMVHFAEAVGARIFALPFHQFLLQKPAGSDRDFAFVDLTGRYADTELRHQLLHLAGPAARWVRHRWRAALRQAASRVPRRTTAEPGGSQEARRDTWAVRRRARP
jgi:hypothetical protein